MDLHLADRTALVTGASKGIGPATTRAPVAEGARVVAGSRASTPELDALGPAVRHLPVHLMDPDAPARLVDTAPEAFGGLDVLVDNAGSRTMPTVGFLASSDDDRRAAIELNLLAAVRCARAAIPVMLERGGGAGRLIDPAEVAAAVLLLVSPRSGSTTGADLLVDAGQVKAV